jgi:hypothetical protein
MYHYYGYVIINVVALRPFSVFGGKVCDVALP